MTKRQKRIVSDPNQMGLFDLLQQERDQQLEESPGRLNVTARYHASVRRAIKQAPKSREIIAEEMTHHLAETVTVDMINNWTARSHPHRMPPEYHPAFCVVTGSNEPLRILNETAGVFTLPGPDALRAEIQKLDEQSKRLTAEKKKRLAFLQEMEGDR